MLKHFLIGLGLFCLASGLPQSVTQTTRTVETSESEGYLRQALMVNPAEYCPAGFRLENGRCISNQPECEPGSVLINGMCYKQSVNNNCNSCGSCMTACPAGFQLVNGVCQQIQRPCTNNCVQPPPPPPPPVTRCPQCPPCIQQPCPVCPQCPPPRPDPIILPPPPTPCCSNPGSCYNNPSPCQAASTLGNLYRRYRRSIKDCQPEKNSK